MSPRRVPRVATVVFLVCLTTFFFCESVGAALAFGPRAAGLAFGPRAAGLFATRGGWFACDERRTLWLFALHSYEESKQHHCNK